ncbi:MAG: HAMP domain-containing histidine kinase, partial [Deltaproteobacteria bacterium]
VSWPRSLRWRLTLAFTAVAGVAVLAASVGAVILVEHAVWDPIDAALAEEAETLAVLGDAAGSGDFSRAVARVGGEREFGGGKFVRMRGMDGRVLAATGTIPDALAGEAVPAVGGTRYATIGQGRGAYRIVWYAAPGVGWSEIGIRVGRELRTLRRVQMAIAASAALLLGALAFLAWAMTTRATAELDQLAAQLETLEAASLDRRLAQGGTSEVDRLVAVLNRLLSRLETAVGHLRRFTADAAHELRTPIAALRAHLEVALARGRSPDGYRNGLLDALEQAERLGRVAADLLTLSAVEAGAGGTDVVRLDAVAREVADFLEPVAQEQGRRFACESERPVAVCGAPDLLKRLVLNLVDNAFRHTPPSAAVRLAVRSDDGTATIEVDDDGPGIPATDLPQVFERFRRGRGATAGTGLGLALCQEIATRHHGRIALESAPGAGTRVTVTLPLADAGAGG